MKSAFYLIVSFVLLNCASTKTSLVAVEHINQKSEGVQFVDSLMKSGVGVDTLLSYHNSCAGCIPGTSKEYYIFWKDSGDIYAKRITNYAEYEILNIHSFPFSFFYSLKDSLATEDIMTFIDGMNIISHGGYEECRFEIADFKEGFHVYSRVLETYQYSLHAAYLNAIRSELYLISRHYHWNPQNLILEKRKN